MVFQTTTPYELLQRPDKNVLKSEFVGKSLDGIRTPALVVDRCVFAQNCAKMHQRSQEWGATFRAHLKTHKTAEGTRLQLITEKGRSHAVVVSTVMEAWGVSRAGLVEDKTVTDILYGLPVGVDKIADLSNLWQEIEPQGGIVRLLIDHPEQVDHLEDFEKQRDKPKRWSVFVKVHSGQNRAGIRPESQEFRDLLKKLLESPATSIHGFYGHAGDAYGSTSLVEASSFLSREVRTVNAAAAIALKELARIPETTHHSQPFVLSVGSTPSAHTASADTRRLLSQTLHGSLELHAGNYPMLDLQQRHTTLIDGAQISQRVRATVISYYPGRGDDGGDEALVDAGAIAFSKDTGPSGGYGEVLGRPWRLSRISQEHGILTQTMAEIEEKDELRIGTVIEVVGQHACLITAVGSNYFRQMHTKLKQLEEQAYPWYYVVDQNEGDGQTIVDVWVPWKGW